jgi:hypothetical protein
MEQFIVEHWDAILLGAFIVAEKAVKLSKSKKDDILVDMLGKAIFGGLGKDRGKK